MADHQPEQRVVADKWVLGEGLLGRGGFGFVKLGRAVGDPKQKVALKFLVKDPNVSERRRQSNQELLATEIDCMKRLQHNHILTMYEAHDEIQYPKSSGELIPCVLLVLELARGGDLFDILYFGSKLPEKVCRTYTHQLASAIAYMHSMNICHRDLKPRNLLLDRQFQLKVTDFGLAQAFGERESPIMLTPSVGTAGFQAPEQILGTRYTLKVDVFAVGVIAFQLLTAKPPFRNAKVDDKHYKFMACGQHDKFYRKHGLQNEIPSGAKDFVNQCINYQPRQRLTSQDLLAHPWLRGEKCGEEELRDEMKNTFRKAMSRRRRHSDTVRNLQTTFVPNRSLFNSDDTVPISDEPVMFINTFQITEDAEPDHFMNTVAGVLNNRAAACKKNGPFAFTGQVATETGSGEALENTTIQIQCKMIRRSEESPVLFVIYLFAENSLAREFGQEVADEILTATANMLCDDVDEFAEEE